MEEAKDCVFDSVIIYNGRSETDDVLLGPLCTRLKEDSQILGYGCTKVSVPTKFYYFALVSKSIFSYDPMVQLDLTTNLHTQIMIIPNHEN